MAEKKFTLRIPEDLHAKLEEIAKREHRSLQGQIITFLEEAVRQSLPPSQEEEQND